MPDQLELDCSFPEVEIKPLDNWILIDDFVTTCTDTNMIIVCNLNKFIIHTKENNRIAWYNVENGNPFNLHTQITDIDYLILHNAYFDHKDDIIKSHLSLVKFKEDYKIMILDNENRVMVYND